MKNYKSGTAQKFDALQIETIINRTTDLICAEKDKEFFRGMLQIVALESPSSIHFTIFVTKLLNQHHKNNNS